MISLEPGFDPAAKQRLSQLIVCQRARCHLWLGTGLQGPIMTKTTKPDTVSLADLRRQIDAIDDEIHAALIRRAALVDGVARAKRDTNTPGPGIRPGREADIVRRLLSAHEGPFPRRALVRIWREIVNAMTSLQGPFAVAVHIDDGAPELWDMARDHFGSVVPLRDYDKSSAVIRAVLDQPGTVGVLRFPEDGDADPWWTQLAHADPKAPRIIARLPFATDGEPEVDACVIARSPLDGSTADRALFVLETAGPVSRASTLEKLAHAGFPATILATLAGTTADSGRLLLIEAEGRAASPTAQSLSAALGEAVVAVTPLGGYAVPVAL
jgi:chorismate mutase-like protein